MSEQVRAELRRTGGFAGREVHVRADATSLTPPQAARLIQLVSTLDLAALTSHPDGPAPHGADLMRYDLRLQRGSQTWQGTFHEPRIPPEIRPLLQFLVSTSHSDPTKTIL
jgi:hypothetical protein